MPAVEQMAQLSEDLEVCIDVMADLSRSLRRVGIRPGPVFGADDDAPAVGRVRPRPVGADVPPRAIGGDVWDGRCTGADCQRIGSPEDRLYGWGCCLSFIF